MPSSSTNAGVLTRMRTGKQKRPLEDTTGCSASEDRLATATEVCCPKMLSSVRVPLTLSSYCMLGGGMLRSWDHSACDAWVAFQRPVAVHEPGSTCVQVKRRPAKRGCQLTLMLYVRWFSPSGKSKVNRLLLRPVTSVDALQVCDVSHSHLGDEHVLLNADVSSVWHRLHLHEGMRWCILHPACASVANSLLPHVQHVKSLLILVLTARICSCQDACLASVYLPLVEAGSPSASARSGDLQKSGVEGVPFGTGAARLPDLPGVPQVHADRGLHVSAGRDLPHRVPPGGHARGLGVHCAGAGAWRACGPAPEDAGHGESLSQS